MKKFCSISVIVLLFISNNYCQNLEGLTGLLLIPTAEMQSDKQINLGVNYLPKGYVSFGSFQYNSYSPYLTLNYLPFLEISFRITRLINLEGNGQAIGDRTPSIRLRFLNEGEIYPAIVFGLHDLITAFGGSDAIHNNALYLVTSKHLYFYSFFNSVGFHLGYGVDWMKADAHNFVGFFGGFDIKLINAVELMGEYDAKRFNTGFRLTLFNHLKLLAGFLDMKHFSGGAGFSFQL